MKFAFFIPFLLISLNLLIYLKTENKIEKFEKIPPFMSIDFTGSYQLNSDSRLLNLLDRDPKTTWKKEKQGGDEDIFMEMQLSHRFQNGFIPRYFKNLVIIPCSDLDLDLKLIARESINVDKELRMPEEKTLAEWTIPLSSGQKKILDIRRYYQPLKTDTYPENINIIGVRGKIKQKTACLEDLYLEE